MAKQLTFFVDFDGTITKQDVCAAMVEKFAAPGWEKLNSLWEQRQISTTECAQRTLALMEMTPAQLVDFTAQQQIDPGFIDFVAWAKQKGYPVYILSDGYENHIGPILNRYQLALPFYANRLYFQQRWRIETPHYNPDCGRCGVCKSSIMQSKAPPGGISIYIGDGYSDRCPAGYADLVFAKAALATYCANENIAAINYESFAEILKYLQSDQHVLSKGD